MMAWTTRLVVPPSQPNVFLQCIIKTHINTVDVLLNIVRMPQQFPFVICVPAMLCGVVFIKMAKIESIKKHFVLRAPFMKSYDRSYFVIFLG